MSTSEKQLPSPVMTGADNGSRNWENLVDALGAIIWEADPETTQFTFVSQKAEELLGYPCEQWLTEPDFWVKHLHPEDRKWAVEFCREATAALKPHDFEYRFIAADGRTVWLRDIVTVIAEGGKPVRLWGVMIDVTRQKELKAELAFQKTLLESLMETSPEGILVVSSDRKWLTYNQRFIEMWNIPEEVVRSRSSKAALKAVQNLLEDPREFQAKIEYLYAHPDEIGRDEIRLRDGRIFDRYTAPVRDNTGRHYGRAWFYRDITHQKQIEEKLRFAQFSVDQAPETILWVDRQGRILYANEAAGEALGYSREALQQLRVSDIDPNLPPEKWDEHWQICKREGTRRLETMHRRKDGSLIPVEVSINHLEFQGEEYHCSFARNISDWQQATAALRESQQRYQILYEHNPSMYFTVNSEGTIISVNRFGAMHLGYKVEDLKGRSVLNIIAPKYRQGLQNQIQKCLRNPHTVHRWELQKVRKDGSLIWVEAFASAVPTGSGDLCILMVSLDITGRKTAELALMESEERYRSLVELSPDAIAVHQEGKVVFINAAGLKLMGATSPEEVIGRPALDFVHPDHREKVIERIRRLESGKAVPFVEEKFLRLDGSPVEVEVAAIPITFGGKPAVQVVARDITERKRAEELRRKLEADLLQAQKLESLGVLAGGIAHDFNNLLTGILGNAELVQMDVPPDSPSFQCLDVIRTTALRASELCQQMLAYAGKARFEIKPVNLNSLIREMVGLLKISISKKAQLEFHLAPELPAVEADATQIRQVVMNLVTNASEAMENQSGVINIATGTVRCDAEYLEKLYLGSEISAGEFVYIEVADTGCGMDKATQQRIFDPFFTTKFTGRGLGLAAVLGIVRSHKGAVEVKSAPGEGTTFRILLPVSSRTASGDKTSRMHPPQSKPEKHHTVLVVDDEEPVRELCYHALHRYGYTVLTAANGEEALQIFQKEQKRISLVILDMTMPRLSGEETLQELRKLSPEVPVILMSGYSEEEAVRRFGSQSFAGFVKKPFLLPEFLTRIEHILSDRKKA